MNLPQLVLHSASFSFFLISAIVYEVLVMVCFVFKNINRSDQYDASLSVLTYIGTPFMVLCAFISLSLLVVIFVRLSTLPAQDITARKSDSSYKSIEVAEFDEDAELQARLWN